jgi:hypothetical protein
MTNPKGQDKKITVGAPIPEAETDAVVEPVVEVTTAPNDVLAAAKGSLDNVLAQAERAYSAYMEAQKEVARAYKENEQQIETSYKQAERKANDAFQRKADQLAKVRDEAIVEADSECRLAKEAALRNYEEKVKDALTGRSEDIDQAWQDRKDTVELAWKMFVRATG